jgi:hypothetical protein
VGFTGGGEDRLSDLPDGIIGHILSFLPSKEAGRAAVLSRRWRHIFANVHAISLEEHGGCGHPEDYHDNYTFYDETTERRSLNAPFLDDVSAALLCRRRCGGLAPDPWLRTFRVAFNCYHPWDRVMVDRWLFSALQQISKEELHLDLRFGTFVACDHYDDRCYSRADGKVSSDSDEDDRRWRYRLPRRIFSIAVLQSLRVSYCKLNPPEAIVLPCVETLHLTGVCDSWHTIRRLISGCPRLADLTLEDCDNAKRVSIPYSTRLHRFTIRSCHNAVSMSLDASELTTLDYKGPVLTESFLNLHGAPRISSSTISPCSASTTTGFLKFLENFKDVKHLHLQFGGLTSCLIQREGLPTFTSLRKLELTWKIHSGCDILTVSQILDQTPNLEVLSLFLVPDFSISKYGWERDYDYHMGYNDEDVTPDDVVLHDIPCLRCRVREINLVHYQGTDAQRSLAKLLLNKAQVLEKLRIVFPTRALTVQTAMFSDIKDWAVNKTAKMVFSEEK